MLWDTSDVIVDRQLQRNFVATSRWCDTAVCTPPTSFRSGRGRRQAVMVGICGAIDARLFTLLLSALFYTFHFGAFCFQFFLFFFFFFLSFSVNSLLTLNTTCRRYNVSKLLKCFVWNFKQFFGGSDAAHNIHLQLVDCGASCHQDEEQNEKHNNCRRWAMCVCVCLLLLTK